MSSLAPDLSGVPAVRSCLAEVLPHPGGGSVAALAALRNLAKPAALWSLLDAIQHDDEVAGQVAAASSRHVLGFDKFVLFAVRGGELRLHVWWPGELRRREHIHDHRFRFASVVLAGTLRNHMFQFAESGRPMVHHHEMSTLADGTWRFEHAGQARIRECLVVELAPGGSYTMGVDLLHRVETGPALTATLVLQEASIRTRSSVLLEPGAPAPLPAMRTPFTLDQFRHKLATLRRSLPSG